MVTGVTFSSLKSSINERTLVSEELNLRENLIASGLQEEQIAALFGVTKWKQFLFSDNDVERTLISKAIHEYGFSNNQKRIISTAKRTSPPDGSLDKIIIDIVEDRDLAKSLIDGDLSKILDRYKDLSKSQVGVLSNFVQHQFKLDKLSLAELAQNFPFRIIQPNFFGRFIAGGCEDPELAVRHLQLSLPFFIRMRSMIEGLCNNKQRFLVVDTANITQEDGDDCSQQKDKKDLPELNLELKQCRQLINSCINNAYDLSAGKLHNNVKGLNVIEIPSLPEVPFHKVETHERTKLCVEFAEWLFFEKRDGEILNRKNMMPADERRLKRTGQELKRKEQEYRKLDEKAPLDNAPDSLKRKWGDKVQRLEKKIEEIKDLRRALIDERRSVKPIIFELERNNLHRNEIIRFRREVEHALKNGARIVFSTLGNQKSGSIYQILDRIYIGKGQANSPAVQCIRKSAFLMTRHDEVVLEHHRAAGINSCIDQQLRAFEVDIGEINQSVKYVVGKVLPDKTDVRLLQLIDPLISYCKPPGIEEDRELLYAVRSWHNRQKISIEELLEYAFDHAIQLSEAHLKNLLETLRELGVEKIPDKCKEIITNRFNLSNVLADQFEVYTQKYRPKTIGPIPGLFESQTSLGRYLDLHLDGCGMAPEVDQIEQYLVESGIVGIINGTDYHPELVREIADTKVKGSTEITSEIWGDYVRLPERLVRSLALRLVEAEIGKELKDSSLVVVQKPDKKSQILEMLYKKFLGIDLGLSPDFDKVNSVIAELAIHNPKTILVLDAAQVKDFTQYRKLVDSLRRSRLKVIIINLREALPGIPHVQLESFIDCDLPNRINRDRITIYRKLGLAEPISEEVLTFTSNQVKLLRKPTDDPLNLNLQVLTSAAQQARMHGYNTLNRHDIVQALPAIFHRPDSEQLYSKIKVVRRFAEIAPYSVFGQQEAIEGVSDRIESHLLGLRDPIRPLTMLLTGPTGVGKTELMKGFAMAINFPFFLIEGSQFTESHTISRLIGSPTGYVGPDEGVLYKFAKDNVLGLVFVDEIEKMHYDVYMALLNFWDIGILTSGSAETVARPGFIIVGASNAGADKLRHDMKATEVRTILSDAFRDRNQQARPELVARFDPILMLAINSTEFRKVLSSTLTAMGERFGWVNANLELAGVDDEAVDILFDASRELCEYEEKVHRLGFGAQSITENHLDLYYNLRHVSRAVDQRAGESLRELVTIQYSSKAYARRGLPKRVVLTGDRSSGLIKVADAPETRLETL